MAEVTGLFGGDIIAIDNAGMVKDLAFQLKGEVENLFLILSAEVNGKPSLTIMIYENIVSKKGLNAG